MPATTNAKWEFGVAPCDADNNPLGIDTVGAYECHVKANPADPDPVVKFKTGGGVGFGTITIGTAVDNGQTLNVFFLDAALDLVDQVKPGHYFGDILRTDSADPEWQVGFEMIVAQGVTII